MKILHAIFEFFKALMFRPVAATTDVVYEVEDTYSTDHILKVAEELAAIALAHIGRQDVGVVVSNVTHVQSGRPIVVADDTMYITYALPIMILKDLKIYEGLDLGDVIMVHVLYAVAEVRMEENEAAHLHKKYEQSGYRYAYYSNKEVKSKEDINKLLDLLHYRRNIELRLALIDYEYAYRLTKRAEPKLLEFVKSVYKYRRRKIMERYDAEIEHLINETP